MLQPLAARWNVWCSHRAGLREVPYLESVMTVRRWDLEQRSRQPLLEEQQVVASVRLWRAITRCAPRLAVDVGASYGAFTLAGRYAERTRCVAFEPNPDVWQCLEASVHTHPDAERIALHRLATSDCAGTIDFRIDTLKSGCSSLHQSPRFRGAVKTISTEVTRLDDFFSSQLPRSGDLLLIKTDTEGNDFRVLLGAKRLLESCNVVGLCEFAPDLLDASGSSPAEFFGFLAARFQLWRVYDKPLPRLQRIHATDRYVADLAGNLVYATDANLVEAAAVQVDVPIE